MKNKYANKNRQENIKNRFSKNPEEQKRLEIQGRLHDRMQKAKQERSNKNIKGKTVSSSGNTSEEETTMTNEQNNRSSSSTSTDATISNNAEVNQHNGKSIQHNNGAQTKSTPANHNVDIIQHNGSPKHNNGAQEQSTPAVHNNTKTYDELKYKPSDIGPFIVFLQKININVINVGKMLKKLNIPDIIDIDKVNNMRVRVVTRNYKAANKIMENYEINEENKYKTFIPNMFVQSVFVVHDVPVEITMNEMEEELISTAPILKIERMKRWNRELKEAQDCNKIKVTIRTTTLPKKITMYGANMRFDYFIPSPIICRNCLRYGHVSAVCKGKPTCQNCAEIHDLTNTCENKTKCKYCKEEHKTMDPSCKERSKQRDIKKSMVLKRLSYHMAVKEYLENANFPTQNNGPTYSEVTKIQNELQQTIEINTTMKTFINNIQAIFSNIDSTNAGDNDNAVIKICDLINSFKKKSNNIIVNKKNN